jgi:hypothetical protein
MQSDEKPIGPSLKRKIEAQALQLWRDQQRDFPRFTYRHNPDKWDYATGTWDIVLRQAYDEVMADGVEDETPKLL